MRKSGSECQCSVVRTTPDFNHLPLIRGGKEQNCSSERRKQAETFASFNDSKLACGGNTTTSKHTIMRVFYISWVFVGHK